MALNIVVFVYRAYNSHAKGTVLFQQGEREKRKETQGQRDEKGGVATLPQEEKFFVITDFLS